MAIGLLIVGIGGGLAAAAISLASGGSLLSAALIYIASANLCVFLTIGVCALRTWASRAGQSETQKGAPPNGEGAPYGIQSQSS